MDRTLGNPGQGHRRALRGPGPSTQGGSWSWKQVVPLPPARSAHRCVHPSRRSILALEGKSCDSSLLGERLSGAHSHQPHLCPAPHPQLSCRGSRVWGLQPREGAIIQQVGTSQLQLLPSVWPELCYLRPQGRVAGGEPVSHSVQNGYEIQNIVHIHKMIKIHDSMM